VPSIDTRVEVAVGLVYPPGDLSAHLRDALRDLGAHIVYETETARFDRAALDRSGAQVVVVNLDPDSDEQIDAIGDLLVDDSLKVVFNDGEVTSKLSGYDLARWARHLASKIVGDAELLPPRPEGAEAVPVRSMPQHALTKSDKPRSLDAPSVSDQSMREATDAIASALASFDMHATKLEAKNAPAAPADDLSALLGDFGLDAPEAADSPDATGENPFADLGLELDLSADALTDESVGGAVEFPDQADVSIERAADIDAASEPGPAADVHEANPFGDIGFDLDFDKVPERSAESVPGLDDMLAGMSAAAAVAGDSVKTEATDSQAQVKQTPLQGRSADSVAGSDARFAGRWSLAPESGTVEFAPSHDERAASGPSPALSFNIDHLSLEPTEEERGMADPFADRGMASESVLHGARASQKVQTTGAEEFQSAPSPSDPGTDDFSFTLDDMSPPQLQDVVPDLTAEEDDFMREFAAMTAATTGTPAADAAPAAAGPLARVWVLGASIGGPDAVREFLAAIPPNVAATFVLAQHMGADFVDLMVAQLQKATRMPVAMATSGMHAAHGQVLVVPIAERMLIDPSGEVRVVALDDVSPYSPSIDRALIDVADRFGANAGAIIFSGMAHDAIEGAKHLAAKGGQVWVQDPATCVVSSMIDGAMEAGIVGFIGTPADLAAEFVRRFGKA
jgi:chemosensory pili system protein ChpB (putative protein-glutamate methylesterase)